ncbi:hypothetical protein OG458_42220 (plasmid) [Streptomyces sp. NBC_01281]|uniref:hypothetical protein n=1 Tax=Streptomyces sp. NBC_01281 TaxID=2903811 RepID=UPI002E11B610|nr:hypothetical protein OG458_42220 [Streptomyces sp. NBC_01281]
MPETKAAKIRTRVEALRAMIDNECTAPVCRESGSCRHEGEKEAARHMLGRLLDKLKGAATDEHEERAELWAEIYKRGYDSQGNTYRKGAKYRAGQPMKERISQIRTHIKIARRTAKSPLVPDGPGLASQALQTYRFDPIGEAPEQIKFRVRIGAGYGSVRISIDNIPEDWGWIAEEVADYQGEIVTRWKRTPALNDLVTELKAIGEAYNADHGSNLSTDSFMKAFYVFVKADDPETLALRSDGHRTRHS